MNKFICFSVILLLVLGCAGRSQPSASKPEVPVKLACEYAGFNAVAESGFEYENTEELTKPLRSFGLSSKEANQKIIFVIKDALIQSDDLTVSAKMPTFCNVSRTDNLEKIKVEEDQLEFLDGQLKWFEGRYRVKNPGERSHTENILLGLFPSPVKGKCVLVIGRVMNLRKGYSAAETLWLLIQMTSQYEARTGAERLAKLLTLYDENRERLAANESGVEPPPDKMQAGNIQELHELSHGEFCRLANDPVQARTIRGFSTRYTDFHGSPIRHSKEYEVLHVEILGDERDNYVLVKPYYIDRAHLFLKRVDDFPIPVDQKPRHSKQF